MGRRIVDLSYTIKHQMKVYPGDPSVEILPHCYYEDGYFVSRVVMGTHSGTHVDAPVHKIPRTESITDLSIECYISWKTAVLDFTGITGDICKKDCMRYDTEMEGCDGVIFKTGWGKHFGTDRFFEEYPGLGEDIAEYLKEKGIRVIGLETPSVHAVRHQEIHEELLKKGIYIVESLANVSDIQQRTVEFHAVPLKLEGLDGSPVRAYVIENI